MPSQLPTRERHDLLDGPSIGHAGDVEQGLADRSRSRYQKVSGHSAGWHEGGDTDPEGKRGARRGRHPESDSLRRRVGVVEGELRSLRGVDDVR